MNDNCDNEKIYHADVSDIKRIIPHRYPFLMIDAVRNIRPNKTAIGIKNVTVNEPFFQGHFPQRPIMPGILIIEALGQTSAILAAKTLDITNTKGMLIYFMTLDRCKFRHTVSPPDQLELHVRFLHNRGNIWRLYGKAKVNNKIVTEAELQAMFVKSDGN